MIEQPAQFRPSPKHCLEGGQGDGVGRDDRIELGKWSPTMAPGTFLGEFLGKSDLVLLLESGNTSRENELRRRFVELHQGRAVQGVSQGKMDEDLASDLGCWPIYPSPSACHLGHVPLHCSFPQLFREKALWDLFMSVHNKALSSRSHIPLYL